MGFSFNPLKGITRALNIPDKARPAILTGLEVVFPVIALGNELAGRGVNVLTSAAQPKPQTRSLSTFQSMPGQPNTFNIQYPGQSAPQYVGGFGGGGFDNFYQGQQFGGASPWDYSTGLPTYSTTQYPVYSAPRDRSWEDLALGVLPLFL